MSFQYQQKWTDRFREQADAELVVENQILPIHILFLQESEILQGCFEDTTNDGKPRVTSCFEKTKLKDMDAFLCRIYPNTDPLNKLIDSNSIGIIQIAKVLGCTSVIDAVKFHLESKPETVTKGFSCLQPVYYEKWLSVISDLGSQKLELEVVKAIVNNFDRLFQHESEEKWLQVFSMFSGQAVMHLLRMLKDAKDKSINKKLSIATKCTKCKGNTVDHKLDLISLGQKEKKLPIKKTWTCSKCGGNDRMNVIGLV